MTLRLKYSHDQTSQIRVPNKPVIYFAGKIAPNCWRHDLVDTLRAAGPSDGPINCGSFIYNGPFFISCDHKCHHGEASHGVLGIGCEVDFNETRRTVFKRNQAALKASDVIFAYIDASDCYGTLIELGWASCAGIPIFLAFAPSIDLNEFWYAHELVARSHLGVAVISREGLPALFRAFLAGMTSK